MWIIDDEEEFDDIDDVIDYVFDKQWYIDNYDSSDVDEWINECYYDQKIEVGGTTIYPADAIKECEPYLYDDLVSDWADGRSESDADYYYSEIENMSDGDFEWYNGFKVKFVEQQDVEEEDENEDEVNEFNAVLGATTHSVASKLIVCTVSEKAPSRVQVIS